MTAITFALICVFSYNKISSKDKNVNSSAVKSKYTVVIDAGHG